jgi:ureidoacrylate peracid hydrolase
MIRKKGGFVIATLFTLVPGKDGEPILSPHLKNLRPFPGERRFRARLLGTATGRSASARRFSDREGELFRFLYDASRMGVAQERDRAARRGRDRDEWRREFHRARRACAGHRDVVLSDGCAAFSREVHDTAIEALRPVSGISTVAEMSMALERI